MSKRIAVLVILLGALAGPLSAADKRCTGSTQECLDGLAKSLGKRGWVGVEFDTSDERYVINRVVEGSPAEAGGLHVGDELLGVNGKRYSDPKVDWSDVEKDWRPGSKFDYIVLRRGKEKIIRIKLGVMPDRVRAMIIGSHMLEHVSSTGQAN